MWATVISKRFVLPYLLLFGALMSVPFRSFVPPACTRAVLGPFGTSFIFNCDSAQFMQDSQDPSRILSAGTSYQDRPLYALLAHWISFFLRPFLPATENFTNSEGQIIQFQYSNLIAFVLMHLLLLFIGLYLLLEISRNLKVSGPIKVAMVSAVFLNDIIKGFFWTPHTQVFSLYMVCFAFYSWGYFQRNDATRSFVYLWFILSSVQIFFYPILVLVLLIPIAVNWKRYLPPSIIALIPYLIYPFILQSFGGIYRNPQTDDFKQFVWIFEDNFLTTAGKNLSLYLQSFSASYVILIAVLFLCLFFGSSKASESRESLSNIPIVFFLGGYFLFLYFIGLYTNRLPIPLFICVIVLLLIEIDKKCNRAVSIFIGSSTTLMLFILFFFFQGTIS
jgi:hypothetical protein